MCQVCSEKKGETNNFTSIQYTSHAEHGVHLLKYNKLLIWFAWKIWSIIYTHHYDHNGACKKKILLVSYTPPWQIIGKAILGSHAVTVFIYFNSDLRRTREYFTCTMADSIMVWRKQPVLAGNPRQPAGCWNTVNVNKYKWFWKAIPLLSWMFAWFLDLMVQA